MYICTSVVVRVSNDEDTERLVAEIPSYLKQRVDADPRDNRQVVIESLESEFQTAEDAAVRRRINEKERRISNVKSERDSRNEELERLRSEVKSLEKQLETVEEMEQRKENAIDERLEKLQDVRGEITESHPTVEAVASDYFNGDTKAALEAMKERNDELELVPEEYL